MRLKLDHVHVVFPVLEQMDRSLRASLVRSVGGEIRRTSGTPEVHALKDVSIDLVSGDRLAVMGHNGAGKSTLLKVCAGIYEPTAGTISRVGSVASMTDFLMGMDPALTGYQNIERRAVFMGLTPREAKCLVPEIAAFCELGEFLALPMRTYSTGMFIRLAFAIATSVQSDIMILDEMINAGDMSFMEKSNARMSSMIERARVLVFASHDLGHLERICNRAVVLSRGAVVHQGLVADCAAFYRDMVSRAAD